MTRFREFLINEDKNYLGRKVNDVLTTMQDIEQDMPNLGARHLNRMASGITDNIRKILHSPWKPHQYRYLQELQKVAAAIEKTIEEKGDLRDVIPAATQSLQTLAGKLGVKVHGLEAPELGGEDIQPQDFQITGQGPEAPPQAAGSPPGPPGQSPTPGQPPMPGPPPGQPAAFLT